MRSPHIIIALGLFVGAQVLLFNACATNEGSEPTFDVPRPTYGQQESAPTKTKTAKASAQAQAQAAAPIPLPTDGTMMRHTLRQVAEYDSYRMERLVDREINLKEDDNESYLNQVAITLGQTVFIQPHFTERETALKVLKGKIDQEDYVVVVEKAANDLLSIAKTSPSASDQAGAMVALTNLVTEVRSMKRPELKDILQKIANANLTISEAAQKYASDPMERLVSPSSEAQVALKSL